MITYTIIPPKEPVNYENHSNPILLFLASPAFGELTKEDIRIIVREEIVASEKRTREYIDLKIEAINARIDTVEKRIDGLDENLTDRIRDIWLLVLALIGLIAAAIAIPQLIIAYREKGQKEMQTQIDQLRKELEAMQQ